MEQVRQAILAALPGAEETISYQMPAYRVRGKIVVYFAAWKKHYAVYPATDAVAAGFAGEPGIYKIANKTFQFSYQAPVPTELIGNIAAFLAQQRA